VQWGVGENTYRDGNKPSGSIKDAELLKPFGDFTPFRTVPRALSPLFVIFLVSLLVLADSVTGSISVESASQIIHVFN
jgi:hypothetical protein